MPDDPHFTFPGKTFRTFGQVSLISFFRTYANRFSGGRWSLRPFHPHYFGKFLLFSDRYDRFELLLPVWRFGSGMEFGTKSGLVC